MELPSSPRVEISVSYRFAQEHNWVIQGLTGFFSAYFMEKPGFRVLRNYEELETGMHVWLCEVPPDMRVQGLLKRLQLDLPPFKVPERAPKGVALITRHVIDCREDNS
jgi:hypothetical protein